MASDRTSARTSGASEDSTSTASPTVQLSNGDHLLVPEDRFWHHVMANLPPLGELRLAAGMVADAELVRIAETALAAAREALRVVNAVHDEQRRRRHPR